MGKTELKMANFKNHRQFTLRCLSNSIIPVSVQLKSNIKTPKCIYIIKKAEKALLNERVKTINNMINMFSWQINTCIEELENAIKKEDMEECYRFIEGQRETRHLRTQKRQLEKFQRLCQRSTGGHSNHTHSSSGICGHSNHDTALQPPDQQENNITSDTTQEQTKYNNNQNWVRNLSRRLLTKAQEKILSHGPN